MCLRELYGIRNTVLNCLVTDGGRNPLVFATEQDAVRWFRLNGNPKCLAIISTRTGLTGEEYQKLLAAWELSNER